MNIYPYAYVLNHYNFVSLRQQPYVKIQFTKKTYRLVKLLYSIGAIQNYLIFEKKNTFKKYILFNATHYKNMPFFKSAQIISRPSKNYTVSYKTLKIINKSLRQSVVILSTAKGLMTHKKALRHRFGGIIIAVLL